MKFLALACLNLVSQMIWQDLLSHWSYNVNWDVGKTPGVVVLALFCPLGQKSHPKIDNFCSSLRTKTTLLFPN